MKKTLALLFIVILAISCFAGCGTEIVKPNNNNNSTPIQSEAVDTNSDQSTPADTSSKEEVEENSKPTNSTPKEENKNEKPSDNTQKPVEVNKNNYFLNDNNNFYDQNAVSVRPRYVYWKDGELVAECYVVNGFAHPVFNIEVKGFELSNNDGIIAEAFFGKLNGVVLQPYTHVTWTFTFPADCIKKYGADITSLIYKSNVTNSY